MSDQQNQQNTQRTVLVTGAAGGLGRAFAEGFAARGDRVAVADIDHEGATRTAEELLVQVLAARRALHEVRSPWTTSATSWCARPRTAAWPTRSATGSRCS